MPSTVLVSFDPPRLAFGRRGGALCLQLGPKTSVGLECTYLSEPRMRICRGATSRTAFVFDASSCAAGGALEVASQEWSDVVARRPLGAAGGRRLVAAVATFLAVRGSPARLLALPLVALAGIVASSTGGIVVDRKPKAA